MTASQVAVAAALSILSAVGCAGGHDASVAAPERPHPEFVELGADAIGSPFTKETVLRLNAIVQKSLDVIREYDRDGAEWRRLIETASAEGSTAADKRDAAAAAEKLAGLSARALEARGEMAVAAADLKSSGEKHNEAILAGMVAFVEKVGEELGVETATMRMRLDATKK